jgi:hypothetical protein
LTAFTTSIVAPFWAATLRPVGRYVLALSIAAIVFAFLIGYLVYV